MGAGKIREERGCTVGVFVSGAVFDGCSDGEGVVLLALFFFWGESVL